MYNKKNIKRLFSANSALIGMLKESENPAIARERISGYLGEVLRQLNKSSLYAKPLEWDLQNECLTLFRRILSIRSEKIAGFSLLNLLWNLAHEKYDRLPEHLSDGWFEEMICLFKGMSGKSGIYEAEAYPDFADMEGMQAGAERSEWLDRMGAALLETVKKYKTGLEEDIVKRRLKNKKYILKTFGGSDEDWNAYSWHLKNVIKDKESLEKLVNLAPEESEAIDLAIANHLPFGITPYYVSLMDKKSHRRRDHAVRAQVIPPLAYVKGMISHKNDKNRSFDFMLEHQTTPIELITRRYPMIVILKPYNTCAQICVYCQRNWEIDNVLDPNAMASKDKLEKAFDWIEKHEIVREVLVTGGDPLVMSDRNVDIILERLSKIDHVERIRIGSRMPVVLPMRITDSLMEVIARHHQPGKRGISLVTHFEHPYEVTPEAMEAVQKFKKQGISVYNQAVFTIENSRRYELVALRRALRLIGVEPYYTFNTKGKEETNDYRVPMARLRQETKEEARLIPGLMRTDEPVYNVPGLGKNYLRALQHHSLISILPDGRRVYEFHPWEKKLSLADTYMDIDVSIYDYLQKLKTRGENIEDYRSIYYYY